MGLTASRRVLGNGAWFAWSLACSAACSSGEGSQRHAKEVTCTQGGCTSQETHVHGAAPSTDLKSALKSNGEGLPTTLSLATYEKLFAATHVRVTGSLAAGVGPAAIYCAQGMRPESLDLVVQIAPVPNLGWAAEQIGSEPKLIVDKVLDRAGKDLLDRNDTFTSDPVFTKLRLAAELPMMMGASASHQVNVETVELSDPNAEMLYASRGLSLTRALATGEPARIEGTLELVVPVDVMIASVKIGVPFERTGVSVSSSMTDGKLKLVISGRNHDLFVAQLARDADGKRLENDNCSQSVPDEAKTKTIECDYDGELASLQIAVAKQLLRKRYAFTLTR